MTSLPSATLRFYALTMLYIIAVMGLNLVFGFAGQVTLGPAAVFAIGAYGAGLLCAKHGVNPMLAILAGVALATIGGAIIGLPALRVGGFYLAMVTAYAAAAIPAAVIIWRSETRGDDGLLGAQPAPRRQRAAPAVTAGCLPADHGGDARIGLPGRERRTLVVGPLVPLPRRLLRGDRLARDLGLPRPGVRVPAVRRVRRPRGAASTPSTRTSSPRRSSASTSRSRSSSPPSSAGSERSGGRSSAPSSTTSRRATSCRWASGPSGRRSSTAPC